MDKVGCSFGHIGGTLYVDSSTVARRSKGETRGGTCIGGRWRGVIDRCLATPPCSRRVDKGVEKGVETLSRFHGSVTGSRSRLSPLFVRHPNGTRDMHHPTIHPTSPLDPGTFARWHREIESAKLAEVGKEI